MLFRIFINVQHLEIESLHITLLCSSSVYLEPIPELRNQFHSYLTLNLLAPTTVGARINA